MNTDLSENAIDPADPGQRWLRIQQVVDHSIDRRLGGDALSDDQIIAAHADLMPELAAELRHLAIIEQARQRAVRAEPAPARDQADDAARTLSRADDDPESCGIPGYETLAELRCSGGVLTWHAIHDSSDREVVIKVFGDDVDAAAPARFENEIGRAAALAGEHLALPWSWGRTLRGNFYIIADFVAAEPLARHVQSVTGADALRAGVTALAQAAELVGSLHAAGHAHGRLAPGNLLVGRAGTMHLLDVATWVLVPPAAPWAPPEWRGLCPSRIDGSGDVFSLGAIFWQVLSGRAPECDGGGESPAQEAGTPRLLAGPGAHPQIDAILLKCLDRDPQQRYATAGQLALELRRWLAGERVAAFRGGRGSVLPEALRGAGADCWEDGRLRRAAPVFG